jgi:glutathione S-transferase
MLMEGPQGRALASFARHYAQTAISAVAFKAVAASIHGMIDERDKPYFRESREKRMGKTLEAFTVDPEAAFAEMRIAVSPLRALFQSQPFVNGDRPAFADYCIFGVFMWARGVSKVKLLAEDDPVYGWRERMLDLFDGLARKAPGIGA